MTAIILAGGASTRMGRDKAMLRVGGIPMLERVARVAARACNRVVVVGGSRPSRWPTSLKTEFLSDPPQESATPKTKANNSAGPLIGLIAALDHVRKPVLLIACDMPLLSSALLRNLQNAHRPRALATMALVADQPEPLLAIYSPRLLPTLKRMLRENRRALYPLSSLRGVRLWPVPPAFTSEVMNVNDPASLARARLHARRRPSPS